MAERRRIQLPRSGFVHQDLITLNLLHFLIYENDITAFACVRILIEIVVTG